MYSVMSWFLWAAERPYFSESDGNALCCSNAQPFLSYDWYQFFFSVVLLEDSAPENGVETNQYSSVSPPASPVAQDEPFSTYFEDKVAIPDNVSQVRSHIRRFS